MTTAEIMQLVLLVVSLAANSVIAGKRIGERRRRRNAAKILDRIRGEMP